MRKYQSSATIGKAMSVSGIRQDLARNGAGVDAIIVTRAVVKDVYFLVPAVMLEFTSSNTS